jgi:tripartite-type tricarboxylate transporter receptor subunit TctC
MAFLHPTLRTTLQRLGTALLLALPAAAAVHAQPAPGWPQKGVRIVVPFPPGGYSDIFGRTIANDLSQVLAQSVVVENRAGAGGNIGADIVAKSAGDGYTLLMGTIGTHAINPALYAKVAFDPVRDFTPIAFVADAETVLVVHPSVAARSVTELLALARARPDELTFASGGAGTTGHLAGEIFKSVNQLTLRHVPYKGNAPALIDLVSGQVSLSFATLQTALPYIRDGRLVPLATLGAARTAALPQVPTLAEAGVRGVEVRNWTGLFAPAGLAPPVAKRLADEVDRIMRTDEVQARLQREGLTYTSMGPDAFGTFVRAEAARWAQVVKASGARVD